MCTLTPQSLHSGKPDASCSHGVLLPCHSLLITCMHSLSALSVEMGAGGLRLLEDRQSSEAEDPPTEETFTELWQRSEVWKMGGKPGLSSETALSRAGMQGLVSWGEFLEKDLKIPAFNSVFSSLSYDLFFFLHNLNLA